MGVSGGVVRGLVVVLVAVMVVVLAAPAAAQLQVTSPDGNASIKFGFLMQGRLESLEQTSGDDAQNLFLRRLRLLAGGKIGEKWSFFVETDSPNLGKGEADGSKNAGDVFIQDFVITYKKSEAFQVDAGMLLIALSHNSNQSAVTLLSTDYGPYSFIWSGPTDSRVGRDYGVRLRGYVADEKLEYRFGVYQGQRGTDSTNDFRYAGRLAYNVFDPVKGLYYAGTSLGKKHILSFGVSADHQEEYDAYSGDFYWDQPLSGGNAFILQGDYSSYDGDVFLPSLPKQTTLMVEAGFYAGGPKLLPYVQYSQRDFDNPASADQEQLQVGLAWMFGGYNQNLKLSYTQISQDGGAPDRDQIWLNFQVFSF